MSSLPQENEIDLLEAIADSEDQNLDAEDVIDLIQGDDGETIQDIPPNSLSHSGRAVALGEITEAERLHYVRQILASRQMRAWWELEELLKQ
jgi:hypothetical protein